MRTQSLIMIFVLSLLPIFSQAAEITKNFPHDLLYKGQPIDPLCFDPMETANSKVSLSTCGLRSEPSEKVNGQNKSMLEKGYIGFDYLWLDEKGKPQSQGFSYYKAFANPDHTYTIYSISSGGGSGQFSSLILAKRVGDELQLKTLAGGDRCNNGIFDVKQKGNSLTYNVNMTAFDFLALSKQNPRKLEAYTDLAACAACCMGSTTIERDLNPKSIANEKVIAVNLDREAAEIAQTNQGKYQVCFNKLVLDTLKSGKKTLTTTELTALMQKFNTQCV
ncbi:MAG: hypothetical protein P4M14_09770 [Gammaproteobacteria bacterium]|nr:hypothetical protein [Gammaproteobacteria bacterium]